MMSPELEKRLEEVAWKCRVALNTHWRFDPQYDKEDKADAEQTIADTFRPLLRQVWREAIEKAAGVLGERRKRLIVARNAAREHGRDLVAECRQSDIETLEKATLDIRALKELIDGR